MSASPETGTGVRRPSRPLPLLIGLLVFAGAVSGFAATAMVGALPVLISRFRSTLDHAGWTVTAFILVAAASAVLCGRLGDRHGRRRVLVAVLLVSALGSLISTFSTDMLAGVITGQAILGVSGGVLPLCFGLARETVPGRQLPVAAAMIAGAATLGGATGAVVAGPLIDSAGWRCIPVATGAVALLAAIGCTLLPRPNAVAAAQRVNWLASLLLIPAITLVLFGVQNTMTRSWSDSRTIASMTVGVVLLAIWGTWELRAEHPMIDVRLLAGRNSVLTMLATAVLAAGIVGAAGPLLQALMQTPELAPVGLGLSATEAAWVLFGAAALGFLLSPVSGWTAARAGARQTLVVGSVFGLISALALALLHGTLAGVAVSVVFLAVATSFALAAIPILIMEDTPEENTGEATGVNVVVRMVFGIVGTSVATVVLSNSLVPSTPFSTSDAYVQGFALIGTCSVVGLVLALFIRPGARAGVEVPSAVLATKV
ncbi:MFS transporter [Streptomyces fulvoviolaceus]|uniref:MFS transporter n=1 Tax=Streptomyces fulvoviolaceus TaxID=285535 RepID=UPI0004CC4F65|nr:MFS transporter [Streptomyces fulvoviolaceus]